MNNFRTALAALSLVLLSAGCGQSGPLYLPGDPSRIESVPPEASSEEDEENEKEASEQAPDKLNR